MEQEERRKIVLSDEDFERIVAASSERAKESALRDIYVAVGKSVVAKALWLFGAAAAAVGAWLHFQPNQ